MSSPGPGVHPVKPRPQPVILLADDSGSMAMENKIGTLNRAIREMLASFADESRPPAPAEIHVAVVAAGGQARVHIPLQPAPRVAWRDLTANGPTALGAAIELAHAILRNEIPDGTCRPVLILLSDGYPAESDRWLDALDALVRCDPGAGCVRMALRIGADADADMLTAFVGGWPVRLFGAWDGLHLVRFFHRLAGPDGGDPSARDRFPTLPDPGRPDSLEELLFGPNEAPGEPGRPT